MTNELYDVLEPFANGYDEGARIWIEYDDAAGEMISMEAECKAASKMCERLAKEKRVDLGAVMSDVLAKVRGLERVVLESPDGDEAEMIAHMMSVIGPEWEELRVAVNNARAIADDGDSVIVVGGPVARAGGHYRERTVVTDNDDGSVSILRQMQRPTKGAVWMDFEDEGISVAPEDLGSLVGALQEVSGRDV